MNAPRILGAVGEASDDIGLARAIPGLAAGAVVDACGGPLFPRVDALAA